MRNFRDRDSRKQLPRSAYRPSSASEVPPANPQETAAALNEYKRSISAVPTPQSVGRWLLRPINQVLEWLKKLK